MRHLLGGILETVLAAAFLACMILVATTEPHIDAPGFGSPKQMPTHCDWPCPPAAP